MLDSLQELVDYREHLATRLKGDWFGEFIDLQLIPVKLRAEVGGPQGEEYSIFELAQVFASVPVAILGEPGAGKTTLVQRLAIADAENRRKLPVFIEMGTYAGERDLFDLFPVSITSETLRGLIKGGQVLFVFDGINEINQDDLDYALRLIAKFIEKHSQNQFIVTCRTGEFPPYLRDRFKRFEVARLETLELKEYLLKVLGDTKGNKVLAELPVKIRDMCRNPLLLNLLAYLYKDSVGPVAIPQSRAALYEQFLEKLYDREEQRRSDLEVPRLVREEFLGYLARKMNTAGHTFIRRAEAQKWIQELWSQKYTTSGINLMMAYREVLTLVPIKAEYSETSQSEDINLKFIHQSFQEYYAAHAMFAHLTEEPVTPLDELIHFAHPQHQNWWETLLLFVGMLDDATQFVRLVKDNAQTVALTEKDQRMYPLVARCISESKHMDPSEVDDTIMRILIAFKYGWVFFDYNLIYSLKLIRPEQRSPDFPPRLTDDVSWFSEKYIRVSTTPLDPKLGIDVIIKYIDSGDEALAIDALSTLRDHPDRHRAAQALENKLHTSSGLFREQVIIGIGYLGDAAVVAVDDLIKIISNPQETKWARLYALSALGKIGDTQAIEPMVDYLLDHANPYRDSASWALQSIAKKHQDTDEDLISRLKGSYLKALLAETDDEEGKYAKGNIVYSIGEFDASEYIEDVIQWFQLQTEPYVLEDGVQAFGKLSSTKQLPLIIRHTNDPDPIVRAMAIDAVVALSRLYVGDLDTALDVLARLENLTKDPVRIVREYAERAIVKLNTSV